MEIKDNNYGSYSNYNNDGDKDNNSNNDINDSYINDYTDIVRESGMVRDILKIITGRPLIILVPMFTMLVVTVLNSYNPILPFLTGLSKTTGSSVFESLVSMLQLLLEPALLKPFFISALAGIVLFSLFAGLFFSGWFHIIAAAVTGREKQHKEYTEGIKKYFLRVFRISLIIISVFVLLSCFLLVAVVPVIVITRAALTTRPELFLAALFTGLLTLCVLFFSLMFARIYLFYWIPAAIFGIKKPFIYAKRLMDRHFMYITLKFIVFDIVFLVCQYMIFVSCIVLQLLLGWLFNSLFFAIYTLFIFYSFAKKASLRK